MTDNRITHRTGARHHGARLRRELVSRTAAIALVAGTLLGCTGCSSAGEPDYVDSGATTDGGIGIDGGTSTDGGTAAWSTTQPPLRIVFDLHADPMSQAATVDRRRETYRRWMHNATWLLDFVEPYGVKISFLSAGEFLEFCLEDPERETTCFPLLRRLHESGGILGTHVHQEIHAGHHDWPSLAEIRGGGPDAITDADIERNWSDTKAMVDRAIVEALGVTAEAAIAAINTAAMGHLPDAHTQASDLHLLLERLGYTIKEGGTDQALAVYFGHVPFNAYRPGRCNVCEDLSSGIVTTPQMYIPGKVGEHFGVQQDSTPPSVRAHILQALVNRQAAEASEHAPKVWALGWGCHTSDIDEGSDTRAALEQLIPFIHEELVLTGQAELASYIDVRDAYLAWEGDHPGESSFDYSAEETDYAQYPYLEWANRYMRHATHVTALDLEGEAHLLEAGSSPMVLGWTAGAARTIDLSETLDGPDLMRVDLANGDHMMVDDEYVELGRAPAIFCAAEDCQAILDLTGGSASAPTPAECGSLPACGVGQVCAAGLGRCVPDCRLPGAACPPVRPTCNAAGLCQP